MSAVQMDETFSVALRAALVEHIRVHGRSASRRRLRIVTSAVVGLAVAGGGVAAASQFWSLPGADVVEHLAAPVDAVHTGSSVVELGAAPSGADRIDITLTCLTAGTFTVADGANMTCSDADVSTGKGTMFYVLPTQHGQHTTTVDTAATSKWRLTVTYSSVRKTPWGVNEDGQTFGVVNGKGAPDLVAVLATNGKVGYASARALEGPTPTSPSEALAWQDGAQLDVDVPVYESDGRTVIGKFVVQRPAGAPGR